MTCSNYLPESTTAAIEAASEILEATGTAQEKDLLTSEPLNNGAECFRFMDLPPEIRDMIYSLLIGRRYYIKLNPANDEYDLSKNSVHGGRLQLLRTSKAINAEASPVLWREGSFYINISIHPHYNNYRFPTVGTLTRLHNIRLRVRFMCDDSGLEGWRQKEVLPCEAPFAAFAALFGGTTVPRGSLFVTYKSLRNGPVEILPLASDSVIQMLTKMVGFEHVYIRLRAEISPSSSCPFHKFEGSSERKSRALDCFVEAIGGELKQSLGPVAGRGRSLRPYLSKRIGDPEFCEHYEECNEYSRASCTTYYRQWITFHPRKHYNKRGRSLELAVEVP